MRCVSFAVVKIAKISANFVTFFCHCKCLVCVAITGVRSLCIGPSWHRFWILKSKFAAKTVLKRLEQESLAVARKDELQPMQFLLQYWLSRSSKVNDFHLIWNSLCHFLLVINSNLGSISPFPRTASYRLKLFIKNCDETTADGDMVTTDSL